MPGLIASPPAGNHTPNSPSSLKGRACPQHTRPGERDRYSCWYCSSHRSDIYGSWKQPMVLWSQSTWCPGLLGLSPVRKKHHFLLHTLQINVPSSTTSTHTLFYNQERRGKEKKIHLFLLVDATQVSGVGGRLGLWGSALSGLGSHTYKTERQDLIGMHMTRS